MASSQQKTTSLGRSRRSAQTIEANESLKSRISRLESLSQPYEDYAQSIQEHVELIKEVNADFRHDRTEALEALNESVIDAGQQYVDKLKSVATSSVEMSTSRLAITLIKRLEDGDELASKYAEKLRSLLPVSGTKRSREDEGEAEQLLPTPPKESAPAADSSVATERSTKRRRTSQMPQTPSKRPSTRSQQLSMGSQAEAVLSPSSTQASAETSAPRRTERAHKPAKRHEDFISWGEVKAEQQKRRKS